MGYTRNIFITGSLLLLLFAGGWLGWVKFHDPGVFPTKVVRVVGTYSQMGRHNLEQMILPYVTNGFLAIETKELEQKLLTVPWVKNVKIKRVWPDTLVVNVTEHTVIGRWNNQGLISNEGVTFVPLSKVSSNLPLLRGPNDQAKLVLDAFERMKQLVKPTNLGIAEVELSTRRAWRLELSNGMQIFLGRSHVLARLKRVISAYTTTFKGRQQDLVYIDARYRNGLAVQWKNNNVAINK